MNTENDSKSLPTPKQLIEAGDGRDPHAEALSAFETRIGCLEDKIAEERFVWIVIVMFLADAFIFVHIANLAAAIVMGLLQLVAVVVLADRCKVNAVMPLIDRLTGFARRFSSKD